MSVISPFVEGEKQPLPDLSSKMAAVISLPRLTFTDNTFSMVGACNRLNISTLRGQGAFWEMALERLMVQVTKYNIEYILTLDYDTVFNEFHILELFDIMEANPDIDALIPLQSKRNNKLPVFESFRHQVSTEGEAGVLEIPDEEMQLDFFEVDSGHFGLTLIRTKNLHKLKRPWFNSIPSENGDWDSGKIPADLYFWKNAKNSGLKICLAPQVYIGHLELVATWPGPPEKGWYGIHTMPAHMALANHCPKWALPKSVERYEYKGIN